MKIISTSDTHGLFPNITESCDVFIHSGDILSNNSEIWSTDSNYQIPKIINEFVPWLSRIDAQIKLITLGNHDACNELKKFRNLIEEVPNTFLLLHEEFIYKGIKFFGTPLTHTTQQLNYNGRWSFGYSEEKLADFYNDIPEDTNVLISHSPPYGILDACPWNFGYTNIGSKSLSKRIFDLHQLQCMIFGHAHDQGGTISQLKQVKFINSARSIIEFKI